jgi:hypothetical protein
VDQDDLVDAVSDLLDHLVEAAPEEPGSEPA